jgi:ferric-dicitrate binding protein FerR (iron transport regulator)
MKKNIDNLLARYFGGNTSEQDMQALEQWISASDENQAYFDQMTKLYSKLGGSESTELTIHTSEAKKNFMAYIANEQKPVFEIKSKPLFYKSWLFQAASIAIIIALSISGWLFLNAERDVVMATRMTLKQGTLSDQTEIKLSKNSRITYSSNYGKKSRKIKLEGEARFSVGHKGNGTLQVCAEETFIEDIGTSFAVSAYPDSAQISVKVSEGKVHFFTQQSAGIMLVANETGIFNKKTKEFHIEKPKTDTLATRVKHVRFNAMILREAMQTISKEYAVTIRFDNEKIANRRITVNFDGENLDMILQVIAETLDLRIIKNANGYLISENTKSTNL